LARQCANPIESPHAGEFSAEPLASASSGWQTPPAASQNSDEKMAGKIASHTRRNETAAQTPLSAASAPALPSFVNAEHNHYGKQGNAEMEDADAQSNSLRDFQSGNEMKLQLENFKQPLVGGGRTSSSTVAEIIR
jgi:hypothetical protein